ncbi:MAG: pyridoxal phosphate-dependent aminotransferase [Desulfovibrio sp.]|jgi:aspartate aminotransferase|nr:pyridoxal phosphate-dependent aminotransferase [Desulfovibrio sp.]
MGLLSGFISENVGKGSMIRAMFEAGAALKKEHGEDAVCDFSLGNPDLPPPDIVAQTLRDFADRAGRPFSLGYMPNAGHPRARAALARHLSAEQGVPLEAGDVIFTCGAAGGINVLLRAVLDPGDEVLAPAPCFVEYGFYAANHGASFRTVPTLPDTFSLDIDAFDAAIGPKTRAVILNSPNNPTGQVYGKEELAELSSLLEKKSAARGRPIFLISDEPYRFLTYDGVETPSLLGLYPYAVVASSFSKNLSLPGERIGYLALSPLLGERARLMDGLTLSNRILGFVNAPVLGQMLAAKALGLSVDTEIYKSRRDLMAGILTDAGYEFLMPKGAFYFFPKAPGGDDLAFTEKLRKLLVLAVPGSGFAGPGYFRLAYCVDGKVIARAAEALKKARAV